MGAIYRRRGTRCVYTKYNTVADVIFCGDSANDWSSGIVGPTIAEILNFPQITSVSQLEVVDAQNTEDTEKTTRLRVTRKLERGYRELLEAQPPLLMTVTAELNEPRYPSLPAHVAALAQPSPSMTRWHMPWIPLMKMPTRQRYWKCIRHVLDRAALRHLIAIIAPLNVSAK